MRSDITLIYLASVSFMKAVMPWPQMRSQHITIPQLRQFDGDRFKQQKGDWAETSKQ